MVVVRVDVGERNRVVVCKVESEGVRCGCTVPLLRLEGCGWAEVHSHAGACVAVPFVFEAAAVLAVSAVVCACKHSAAVTLPLRKFREIAHCAAVGGAFCAIVAVAGLASAAKSNPPAACYSV